MKKTSVRVALVAAVALSTTPAIAQADTEDSVQPGLNTAVEDNAAPAEKDSAQPGTTGENVADAGNAQPGVEEESPAPEADVSNEVQPGLGKDLAPEVEGEQPGTAVDNPSPEADPAVETQPGTSPAAEGAAGNGVQPGTVAPEADPAVETQPGTQAPQEPETPVDNAPVVDAPAPPAPVVPEAPAGDVQPAVETTPATDTDSTVTDEIVDTPPAHEDTTEPVFSPAVNDTPPARPKVADVPAQPPAPVENTDTTPAQQSAVQDEPVKPQPAQPVVAPQPAPKPQPAAPQVLRQGAITANVGAASAQANSITIPGETVINASVSDGRTTVHAPTVSYGTYNQGVAEVGIGTTKPAPIKLDPVTTAVVDAANNAARQTPKPVREATKLPAHGDYRIGGPGAGAHVAWKS